jgi:hypothetical protein
MAKRGRPATGRTSKTVRVPLDMDITIALKLYYDVLPSLVYWEEECIGKEALPRYDRLIKLMSEIGLTDEMREAGK